MEASFNWVSPLGVSVGLFLVIGVLWLVVGALIVPLHHASFGREALFVSPKTDEAFFGSEPRRLLRDDLPLSKLRTLLFTVIAGFLLLAGILFIFIAWFALHRGQVWALAALGMGGLVAIAFWAIALWPYIHERIPIGVSDLPPFIWIPSVLILPAFILGWVGLK